MSDTTNDNSDSKITVLLVDDSAVIRGLLARILEEDPDIEIVGTRSNGEAAITATERYKPQIVVLDIEMPVMDGITALPKILKTNPDTKVLICSTLSDKNAKISLKALSLGASECVLKPSASRDISEQQSFRRIFLNLVRTLSGHKPRDFDKEKRKPEKSSESIKFKPNEIVKAPLPKPDEVKLRTGRIANTGFSALAIGSSTGGPQALFNVLKNCRNIDVPVFITQHMPPTFTKILAEHIESNSGIPTFEAQDGMEVQSGHAYVAAGGYHMIIKQDADKKMVLTLDDGPAENFCKPSVEPMMRSLIDLYGSRLLTVMLTGMGQDGVYACEKLVDLQVPLIAQDKETSVVWGMPGAVATAGYCTDILPLDKIGDQIAYYLGSRAKAS